jgi:hypothetical protein
MPLPTESTSWAMTMGIVEVASLARRVEFEPSVTITSTFRRISSAASAGTRSSLPSPDRHSMTMFFPSMYPSSRSLAGKLRGALTKGRCHLNNLSVGPSAAAPQRMYKAKRAWHKAQEKQSCDASFSLYPFASRLAPHRIIFVARANTSGGIVRPICFAVFKLITNSNFVGCSTGRSAGLVPLRILSTKYATRR